MKMLFQAIALVALMTNFSFGKDIPITQNWEIELPVGKVNILQFPFDIHPRSGSFKTTEIVKKNSDTEIEDDLFLTPETKQEDSQKEQLALPTPSKEAQDKEKDVSLKDKNTDTSSSTSPSKKNKSSLIVKKGTRSLELLAKKEGKIEFIIWGFEKYPLILEIHFKKAEEGMEQYYRFVDTTLNEEKAKVFESSNHEQVISRLTYALFNQKVPSGYRRIVDTQEYEYKELGISVKKIFSYSGNDYVGEYWELSNLKDSILKLDESSFYQDGVYAVSILVNPISAGGTSPVYIIRKAVK